LARPLEEVYACDDAKKRIVLDFVDAWNKVMNLNRFELDLYISSNKNI
jgi:catalase-peroxidase